MTRRQQYLKFFIALILGGVVLIIAYFANGTSTLNPKEIEKLASFIQAIDSGEYTHEFDDGIRKLEIQRIEKKGEDTWYVITKNKGSIVFFDNAKTDNFILIEASFYKLAKNGIKNYFIYAIYIIASYIICDYIYKDYRKHKMNSINKQQCGAGKMKEVNSSSINGNSEKTTINYEKQKKDKDEEKSPKVYPGELVIRKNPDPKEEKK